MGFYKEHYIEVMNEIIEENRNALSAVDSETVERFVEDLLKADQVFFVGVGRVLLSLQAFCKRLAHLGI